MSKCQTEGLLSSWKVKKGDCQ